MEPEPAQPSTPIQSGIQDVQSDTQQVVQTVAAPVAQGTEAIGKFQDMIDDPISGIVNGVTKTANNLLSFSGSQPYLEDDPTGIVEGVSEGLNVVSDSLSALNVNLQEFLKLDPTIMKGLVKVGEAGDRVCDASHGDMRLTVEFPFVFGGGHRQFNLCLDAKTAKTVGKQIASEPLKPVMNAVECGLSEMLLKPVDHVISDVKNIVATIVRFGLQPSDVLGNAKNVVQNGVDIIENFWSGSYGIWLNPDGLSCFQSKTLGLPYETVDIGRISSDVQDQRFMKGERA
jgi:hypothetical protein